EQIFTQTNDLSLFAWELDRLTSFSLQNHCRGLFSFSPELFKNCATLRHETTRRRLNKHCRTDDNGFEFQVLESKVDSYNGQGVLVKSKPVHILDLNCARVHGSGDTPLWLGIRLRDIDNGFTRESLWHLDTTTSRARWYKDAVTRSVRVAKHPSNDAPW